MSENDRPLGPEGPHETPDNCLTWYDGCNCTLETLAHNIARAEKAEADLAQAAEKCALLQHDLLSARINTEKEAERYVRAIERLKALVRELHQQAALYRRGQELFDEQQARAYTQCARKLTAILADSEPAPQHHNCLWPDGCYLCKRKAKLPLGHEFYFVDDGGFAGCALCGQPREAHEPKP